MRKALPILTLLLLAGCVDQSASYMINGDNEHAITVRAEQEYFWSDEVTLRMIVSNLPDCQRQYPLTKLPMSEADVELYASGENVFMLHAGKEAWQVDLQSCAQTPAALPAAPGEKLGTFKTGDEKMVFEPAAAAAPAPAAAAN